MKEDHANFFIEIQNSLPSDFKEFTEVFLSSHTIEADNFWGWTRWETFPEDRAIIVDTMGKLERFYAIRSLQLINSAGKAKIDKIDWFFDNEEYNRDLYFLAKNENFLNFLDSIEFNEQYWHMLEEDEIKCIKYFKSLLKKFEDIWIQIEKENMRQGSISYIEVGKFEEVLIKEFNKLANFRNIFKNLGMYKNRIDEKHEEKLKFGLNRVEDKAMFFEDWHVKYGHSSYEYGKNIAEGEDLAIFNEISSYCKKTTDTLEKTIDNITQTDFLIFFAGTKSYDALNVSGKFKSKYRIESDFRSLNEFKGYYNTENSNIPVFSISGLGIDKILIIRKHNLGKLVQYSPLSKNDDKNLVKDVFYINVRAFSDYEEIISEYLDASIDWLLKIGNKEDQRKYLQEKVWIQIYEKFEFIKDEKFEGYLLDYE